MGGVDRTVALISHDGAIQINGASDVAAGTRLTLAANGVAGSTRPAVRVSGNLDVDGLVIGERQRDAVGPSTATRRSTGICWWAASA